MTRLRSALAGLAEEAPLVSLADAAIAGHRRRRRTRLALTGVAAVTTAAALVSDGGGRGGGPAAWRRSGHGRTACPICPTARWARSAGRT